MTIKWDAEHPDSNTCAEQWHYNVDFRLNNDRCSSDDFLNRDDGSIDMIVYKVEGPRSNLGGILSISSMGNPKDFEWLRNRTKPTARQISISKSLTESMVKPNLCWTGHFIPPPPTENASNTLSFERGPWGERGPKIAPILTPFWRARAKDPIHPEEFFEGNLLLYKVASPGKTPEKTESMLDWPLYTPSPNRECLYKVASPGKTTEKTHFYLEWPLYTPSPNRECLYKVASPSKTPEKNTFLPGMATLYPSPNRECLYKVASPSKTPEKTHFYLEWPLFTTSPNRECLYKVASPSKTPEKTHFYLDWPLYTTSPNRECLYKVASPSKTPEKTHFYLDWNGHFIPPPPTENVSIKWPVQVKPLKKHIFTWNGHFIPQPVGSRTLTRKRKGWQQGKGGKLQRRGTTGRLPQENETCHVYIRLLFSMCHIDWRWLVYWICCRCILEHMYTYDSHININIYKS